MKKLNNSLNNFAKLFCASLYVLAAICFMVYTTETSSKVSAEGEDLGYDITSANASVTVGTACTFSGSVTTPHTSTISNGLSSNNIGTTVLNTTCNDSGGYAVYAIGYTNEEYGNTSLSYTSLDGNTTNSDYDIATGTNTSGNTSNWAMKLSTVSGTTTATIESDANGSFSNYHIVPDDYTKVATLNTITDPGTHTSGSSISTTYQAYISPTQAPGTYTGKVKYTLVHPSTAPAPQKPVFMQDTAKIKSLLINENDTMQAIDKRDGKEYWITKLADGNIWMTQNLDFDIVNGGADLDSTNTDVPADWADAGNLADTYAADVTTWNSSDYIPSSYDPGDLYWNGTVATSGGNLNANTTTYPSATSGGTHYHVGNYYDWTAAVAMSYSGNYTSSGTDANQSICPAGWRLPTYNGDKSYDSLVSAQSLTAGTNGNIQSAPTYFVYGGGWRGRSDDVSSSGGYWSSVVRSSGNAYRLYFDTTSGLYPLRTGFRYSGYSLRCVMR